MNGLGKAGFAHSPRGVAIMLQRCAANYGRKDPALQGGAEIEADVDGGTFEVSQVEAAPAIEDAPALTALAIDAPVPPGWRERCAHPLALGVAAAAHVALLV